MSDQPRIQGADHTPTHVTITERRPVRTRSPLEKIDARMTERAPVNGVAIVKPAAHEIAAAAYQALRAFVATISGAAPTSPAWDELALTEHDRLTQKVQRIAVGDISGGWDGPNGHARRRDQIYSLVVMGILAIAEEDGYTGNVRERHIDLAARVLGWLEDGEAMQVPVFGEILQVLSEHVTGDDDGAVGTARRLSEIAKQAEAMVAKSSAEAGTLRIVNEQLQVAHNLVLRVLEPRATGTEQPHETISRLLGELTSAKARADEQATYADHLLTRSQNAEAELRKVTAAIENVPLSVRDRLSIHSKEAGTAPAGKIATLGGLAMEGILNAQKAQCALDAQAVLEREMARAPITVGGNTVIAYSPLLTERVKLLCTMLINAHEANAQRDDSVAHYRAKALAWEELILWIARDVPAPWSAIVDAHGDDPERWKRWPDQVRRMVRAVIDECRRQQELAEAEADARHDLEDEPEQEPAGVDDGVVIALLRSARARLSAHDRLCPVIDATLDLVDGAPDDAAEEESEED